METTFKSYCSKRISYIITTKNRASHLRHCLSNINIIKKNKDEIILIDGNSSDETHKVVKDFSHIIDIYVSEPDLNGPHAFNKGLMLANGKYIKHIMDDDIFYKEALEKANQVMEKNPEVDMIVCGGIRKQDGKETVIYVPPGSNYGSSVDDIFKNGFTTSGMGIFFRRSLLFKVGLFEIDRPFPDMGFILRSIYIGANVKFCRINMFYHPLSDNSITVINEKIYNKEYKLLLNRYCSERYKRIYRLKNMFWYKRLRIISKIFISLISIKKNEENPITPVWDEGFS